MLSHKDVIQHIEIDSHINSDDTVMVNQRFNMLNSEFNMLLAEAKRRHELQKEIDAQLEKETTDTEQLEENTDGNMVEREEEETQEQEATEQGESSEECEL